MINLRRIFVYFSLFLTLISSALGADLEEVTKLFKSTWNSHYSQGLCGQNIEGLVGRALDRGLNLDGATIVKVVDEGGWMFGMVNALQAREAGRMIEPRPSSGPIRSPGESNWYFHVFLLVDGKVLDFDFKNSPTIVGLNQYLHEMFIPQEKWASESYKLSKMKGYKLELYEAEDYILRLRSGMSRSDIATKVSVKDYVPSFFNPR